MMLLKEKKTQTTGARDNTPKKLAVIEIQYWQQPFHNGGNRNSAETETGMFAKARTPKSTTQNAATLIIGAPKKRLATLNPHPCLPICPYISLQVAAYTLSRDQKQQCPFLQHLKLGPNK